MYCDFHSHVLPGIDDGAVDTSQSLAILKFQKQHDISEVCATSHFSMRHDTVDSFLKKRECSVNHLMNAMENDKGVYPTLRYGAEVKLYRGLTDLEGLDKLCISGTRLLLIEFAVDYFEPWFVEEIYNVKFQFDIVPVIAHLNRFFESFSAAQIDDILNIEGAVIQFNTEIMNVKSDAKAVKRIISKGYPVVFGCDLHSTSSFDSCGIEKYYKFVDDLPQKLQKRLSAAEKHFLNLKQ